MAEVQIVHKAINLLQSMNYIFDIIHSIQYKLDYLG